MARRKPKLLAEQELVLMKIVWDKGEASVQDVWDALRVKRAYTTVMKMLSILERKGFLKHRVEGRSYIYRPAVSRELVSKRFVSDMLNRVFGGSTQMLLANLLDVEKLTSEELEELRNLIDQKEKELGNG